MRTLLHMDHIPEADIIGKWLKRIGLHGVYGIEKINKKLLEAHLKKLGDTKLTLDIDAMVIETEKSTARSTYRVPTGYTPMVGHIIMEATLSTANFVPVILLLQTAISLL